MKRILLISFLFFSFGIKLLANPIPIPMVEISELLFDPVYGWQIELEYYTYQEHMLIDSIWLCSSSGQSKLKHYQIIDPYGLIIVTNDSLDADLEINPEGDSITVVTFIRYSEEYTEPFYSTLVFGNYANAVIGKPKNGHSIARLDYGMYSKDKSPSIGAENDTAGMCGTIRGTIYDRHNQLISERTFKLIYDFESTNEGRYSTRLFSNHFTRSIIHYKVGDTYMHSSMTPLDICLEPDSVIEVDIYLLDSLTGIEETVTYNDFPVKLYPNPVKGSQSLNYTIDLPVKSLQGQIELISLNGAVIVRDHIMDKSGALPMPDHMAEGIYVVHMEMNNSIQYTTRIMVSK